MDSRLACLSAIFVLAGCTAGPAVPQGQWLAASRDCRFEYPDGSPVPCHSQPALPQALPAGWHCLEQIKSNGRLVQLWADGDGHFGVFHKPPPDGRPTASRFWVTDERGTQVRVGAIDGQGFGAFAGRVDSTAVIEWGVDSYSIDAHLVTNDGPAEFMALVSSYGLSAWFVWRFEQGGTRYYFQKMGGGPGDDAWRPLHFAARGHDGSTVLVDPLPYHAAGQNYYGPSALPDLLSPPACS